MQEPPLWLDSTCCEQNKDQNFGGVTNINKITEEHYFTVSESSGQNADCFLNAFQCFAEKESDSTGESSPHSRHRVNANV